MLEWLLLISLGTIWGFSYLFIKIGGSEVPPLTLVAMRSSLAALTLLAVMVVRGLPKVLAEMRTHRVPSSNIDHPRYHSPPQTRILH